MFQLRKLKISPETPAVMGIVNVTPDSFSDGGRFVAPDAAIGHALKLADEGADIIDIGGESSRPGSEAVSADEEIKRIAPVIEGLRKRSDIPISIDTTKAIVAKAAIESGADMVNDISAGRFDDAMLPLIAKSGVSVCLMHMQGKPKTMQDEPHYKDLMGEIKGFLTDAAGRAEKAGVNRSKIIIDPGIGFGKSADDNIEILRNLKVLVEMGMPVLVGASRKSFIGKKLELEVKDRLEASLAAAAVALQNGASLLRVHDVAATRRFVNMFLLCRP